MRLNRVLILAAMALLGSPWASAQAGVRIGINFGIPFPFFYRPYPPPVYVAPAPVYVAPAPVYYQPAPVYYRPAPVYYQPAPVYAQPAPAAQPAYGAHDMQQPVPPQTSQYLPPQPVPWR